MYFAGRFGELGQSTGTYPVFNITLQEYERKRQAVEDWVMAWQRAHPGQYMTKEEWEPALPVPRANYIHDPATGKWYRAGTITQIAYEVMPPVVGGTPGTFVNSTPLSDAEAAAWIAKVAATREPGYGSPETLPERLGWTEGLTPEETGAIQTYYGHDRPTEAPPAYAPPLVYENVPEGIVQALPAWFPPGDSWLNWVNAMGGRADIASALANSFTSLAENQAWAAGKSIADYVARAVPFMKYPQPIGGGSPAPGGPGPGAPYTPPAGYAPNQGTPALRARGWPPDVIGFWLTQAFGGDMALTEAFLLSFSGREALDAWVVGKTAADVLARAHAALDAATETPGYTPPAGGEESGIGLPVLALGAAAAIYLFSK